MNGTLHTGDNLEIMESMASASIDLIYLDPPFNTGRDFGAFDDNFTTRKTPIPEATNKFLQAINITGGQAIYNYLCFMAPRITQMHRLLKPTGSLYLHCDPTASHYLKLLLDGTFGSRNFLNEIVWKRTSGGKTSKNNFPRSSDAILLYTKSDKRTFNPIYKSHKSKYLEGFKYDDNDGRGPYQRTCISSPTVSPNKVYEWKGFQPPAKGWSFVKETMEKWDAENKIYYPRNPDGSFDYTRRPRRKSYLSEVKGGVMVDNNWTDINVIQSQAKERLGYPTQKPLALLERIIQASSNPGDMVFDPFCGSGTTLVAAERLNRRWVGVDINEQARELLNQRLA